MEQPERSTTPPTASVSRRRPASTSSEDSENDAKSRKIRKLEKRLQQFETRARSTAHPGDDKMIPMFDPQKTDITVESWVRRVDDYGGHLRVGQFDNGKTHRKSFMRDG
jgi:hypothetical protein